MIRAIASTRGALVAIVLLAVFAVVRPVESNDAAREIMKIPLLPGETGYPGAWVPPYVLDGAGQVVAVVDTGLDTCTRDKATGAAEGCQHPDLAMDRIVWLCSGPVTHVTSAEALICQDDTDGGDPADDLDIGHGTHVAGVIVGTGQSTPDRRYRGIAPEASLVFHAIEQEVGFSVGSPPAECPSYAEAAESSTGDEEFPCLLRTGVPANHADLYEASRLMGARVVSNSWESCEGVDGLVGSLRTGQYTTQADALDSFVAAHPDVLVVHGAGNSGRSLPAAGDDWDAAPLASSTVCPPGTARNGLTVGAVENLRAPSTVSTGVRMTYADLHGTAWKNFTATMYSSWDSDLQASIVPGPYPAVDDRDWIADDPATVAPFSGRGPTDHGAIKPDLVAPGTSIVSLRSGAQWPFDDDRVLHEDIEALSGPCSATGGEDEWLCAPADSWSAEPLDVARAGSTRGWVTKAGAGTRSLAYTFSGFQDDTDDERLLNKVVQFWTRSTLSSSCRVTVGLSNPESLGATAPVPDLDDDGYLIFPSYRPLFTLRAPSTDWELMFVPLFSGSLFDPATLVFTLEPGCAASGSGTPGADQLWIDDVRITRGPFVTSLLSDHGLATYDPGDPTNPDNLYVMMDGTSMATPQAAGAAVLVRQFYEQVVQLDADEVSAALVKATLINGARMLDPTAADGLSADEEGPAPEQGFGRIDLQRSLDPEPPAMLDLALHGGLATGESASYELEITDTSVPISVTLAYTDAPGEYLRNDLDLSVTLEGGAADFPNGMSGADAEACHPDEDGCAAVDWSTRADANNVERVVISTPSAGTYTVKVHAQHVGTGTQPFALVSRATAPLTQPPESRPGVDLGLAIDRSGSMLSSVDLACAPHLPLRGGPPALPGAGCASRLDTLKEAVELFFAVWEAIAVPDDRIAVSTFASDVDTLAASGATFPTFLSAHTDLLSQIQALTTTHGETTAMGGGLVEVLDAMGALDGPAPAGTPRGVVLFSDGMGNTDPKVYGDLTDPAPLSIHDDPAFTPDAPSVDPADLPVTLDSALGARVATIGVGAFGEHAERLVRIADDTGGRYHYTSDPQRDLRLFYVHTLVDTLQGHSPQLVTWRDGTFVSAVANKVESFPVERGVEQVVVVLSGERGAGLKLQLERDGRPVRPTRSIEGDFYIVLAFDRGEVLPELAGEWSARVQGAPDSAYQLGAIVDQSELDLWFSLDATRVGEPLTVELRLLAHNRPVTIGPPATAAPSAAGAGASAPIHGHVVRPERSPETVLARWSPVHLDRPPRPTDSVEQQTRTRRSLDSARAVEQLGPIAPDALAAEPLTLEEWAARSPLFWDEVGGFAGPLASLEAVRPGIYRAQLGDTPVAGSYRATFELHAEVPGFGTVMRLVDASAVVAQDPRDLRPGDVDLRKLGRDGDRVRYELTLWPRDGKGNRLGPGHADAVRFAPSAGEVEAVDDLGDGRYRVRYWVPRRGKTSVDLQLGERALESVVARPGALRRTLRKDTQRSTR